MAKKSLTAPEDVFTPSITLGLGLSLSVEYKHFNIFPDTTLSGFPQFGTLGTRGLFFSSRIQASIQSLTRTRRLVSEKQKYYAVFTY